MSRNEYMLKGVLAKEGYDWWWHSFVGYHSKTGEAKSFFIEYFIINPALGGDKPIFGQLTESKEKGIKPSYAMIKAGAWGENKAQIHNFYGVNKFKYDFNNMRASIGDYYVDETSLKGKVSLTKAESDAHHEYMCDHGEMEWDLKAKKILSYSVGYGASSFMRVLNAFKMYWHIQGIYTEYEGKIIYNGEEYNIIPEKSYGYQDKNWGQDYTNPWIWLNCNNFVSKDSPDRLKLTSLDVGGGCPVVFGKAIPRKILIAFYYKGELFEYNFSKVFDKVKQEFNCIEDDENLIFNISAENRTTRIDIDFKCPKKGMIKVNYENPKGEKNHNNLWNGGEAYGELKLYKRQNREYVLVDTLYGKNGGCEYGEY